jgi:hypothetical protein
MTWNVEYIKNCYCFNFYCSEFLSSVIYTILVDILKIIITELKIIGTAVAIYPENV